MKQTGKRTLSLILTLCMLLGLLPTFSIGALAANATDVSVGGVAVADVAKAQEGTGWAWTPAANDSTPGTLTLSGADLSSVTWRGDMNLVLEGTNRAVSFITHEGSLTVSGSGTLDVTDYILCNGAMTFNSGYLTVTSSNTTHSAIEANSSLTVNGGCITAASTTHNGISGKLVLNGGYVKATGAVNGVAIGDYTETVNGGYLEASGQVGIYADVSNTNGVIKATGTAGNGITGHVVCTGGVTIASGTTKAISGNITDTSTTPAEKYWTSLTPASTDTGIALGTTAAKLTSTDTSVVIAKTAIYTGTAGATASTTSTLDGAYINATSESKPAWETSDAATVTGGSYVTASQDACVPDNTLTVNQTGTLVVAGTIWNFKCPTLDNNGNLICIKNSAGKGYIALTNTVITNSGNLIGLGIGVDQSLDAIQSKSFSQTGGSTVVTTTASAYPFSGYRTSGDISITGGTVTIDSNLYGLSCGGNLTVDGGTITSIGSENVSVQYGSGKTLTLPTGYAAFGSTAKYGALVRAYYVNSSFIPTPKSVYPAVYLPVVFLSKPAPPR